MTIRMKRERERERAYHFHQSRQFTTSEIIHLSCTWENCKCRLYVVESPAALSFIVRCTNKHVSLLIWMSVNKQGAEVRHEVLTQNKGQIYICFDTKE